MYKSRPMFNSFQQPPNQSSLGSRFDSNMYRQYKIPPSPNNAIAARNQQAFSILNEDFNRVPIANRTLSSHNRDPMDASTFMHSNSREALNRQLQNDFAYGTASVTQPMFQRSMSSDHSSSSNMDQLLANVEYELSCSKVKGEKLSKLLATLKRNSMNNSSNHSSYNGSHNGSHYM